MGKSRHREVNSLWGLRAGISNQAYIRRLLLNVLQSFFYSPLPAGALCRDQDTWAQRSSDLLCGPVPELAHKQSRPRPMCGNPSLGLPLLSLASQLQEEGHLLARSLQGPVHSSAWAKLGEFLQAHKGT